MDNLITLVNKIQRACTALGDHGEESALPTLWDSLPSIAVVGGQVMPTACFLDFVLPSHQFFDRNRKVRAILDDFLFDLKQCLTCYWIAFFCTGISYRRSCIVLYYIHFHNFDLLSIIDLCSLFSANILGVC